MKYIAIATFALIMGCAGNKQKDQNYICDDNKITLDTRECVSLGGDESQCISDARDKHCIDVDL